MIQRVARVRSSVKVMPFCMDMVLMERCYHYSLIAEDPPPRLFEVPIDPVLSRRFPRIMILMTPDVVRISQSVVYLKLSTSSRKVQRRVEKRSRRSSDPSKDIGTRDRLL